MPRSSGSGSFLLRAGDWAERSWKMVGFLDRAVWLGSLQETQGILVTGYSKKREDVEWCRNAVLRSSPSPLNT